MVGFESEKELLQPYTARSLGATEASNGGSFTPGEPPAPLGDRALPAMVNLVGPTAVTRGG
jgi:hypothetical protein